MWLVLLRLARILAVLQVLCTAPAPSSVTHAQHQPCSMWDCGVLQTQLIELMPPMHGLWLCQTDSSTLALNVYMISQRIAVSSSTGGAAIR